METRESDPSIVVGDGRADHTPSQSYGAAGMAKGRAGEQSWQSTHAGAWKASQQSVSSSLLALRQKAAAEPKYRFRSLYRMIDLPMLYDCYLQLRKEAAPGVDGIDVAAYAEQLDERLADLLERLKAGRYLYRVLDLWTERKVRRENRGQIVYMRYADDFVCGFEEEAEARNYLEELRERLAKFGLKLAEAKSGIVRFQRHDERSGAFSFLGFDFYWAKTRRAFRTVKRRTSKKKLRASLASLQEWMRRNRNRRLRWLGEKLAAKFRGYWNYYGVIGNSKSLRDYWNQAQRLVYKWLNRRSQRRSYNWASFTMMWRTLGIPSPRIVEGPYQPQHHLALS